MGHFTFLKPGPLTDGEVQLVLVYERPGDPLVGRVPSYVFDIARRAGRVVVGRIEFRVGNTCHVTKYAGHIGYRVEPGYRGNRYAARACRLLLPLARRHGFQTLWITCDPTNLASRRTCELAGATLVEIIDLPKHTDMYRWGERQKCRYRLDL
jgi:predicted acetyltransferase